MKIQNEIAAIAARMVVEEGLDYVAAKRRAVKQLGLPPRSPLPDNDTLEAAVREHLALFCAETQPQQLRALRNLALQWMLRLQRFRPYLSGAVWHGTATQHSDIYLHLFCDDEKAVEFGLIDLGVRYSPQAITARGRLPLPALSFHAMAPELGTGAVLHLLIHDLDDLRTALAPDRNNRKPMGDVQALQQLLVASHSEEMR